MTIKKQWLLILILIAAFSVSVNTFVLSSLTDQYFKEYIKENYNNHFDQIVSYVTTTIKEQNFSANQMAVDLETHLVDPITRIKVYDEHGILIVDVSADVQTFSGKDMMKGMMGRMKNTQFEEVDHSEILEGNVVIGQINITKYSSAENSFTTWMFRSSLVKNSMYSMGIVLVFAIIMGVLVSKRMSKDLIVTAEMAQNIEIGNDIVTYQSKVKEIRIIQQSLDTLKTRLMLKQKSRKTLIDELVHQTRTPLTILKTHLEGIEDGVIEMVPEEIRICENQIENITTIITNMSGMIDAQKLEDVLHFQEFEFNQLIRQIINGLKVQFEKKKIDLKITEQQKVMISTDKYKLSQAIYNVLTNAYKFTEPQGSVTISYQVSAEHITLIIEDDGPGISEEKQARIFDAYYKSDTTANTAGEGIGLYVARENMLQINGSIQVNSTLKKGSKFILMIPR